MSTLLVPLEDFLDEIIKIEPLVHTHPWSENLLRKTPGKFDCHRALILDDQLVGYFYSQCVVGEASLLNIAIKPSMQKKGFGKILLEHFLQQMQARGASEAFLEVRESNLAAIALYQAVGFNEFDRRYDYYPTATGKEDALIMTYWFE